MDIILQSVGLKNPGKGIFFHSNTPAAFCHLDSRPEGEIGKWARFGVFTNSNFLILKRTSYGITKQLYQEQVSDVEIYDLLQIERTLSELITPFTKLKRIFPKTNKLQRLDEENREMLKSLGYIK